MDVIAVHAGAGFQSESNRAKYLQICEDACQAGARVLAATSNVVDAVAAALVVLENNDITNAGRGSNLCIDGSVECDASLMNSCGMKWGAVGALPGIKNPILVAKRILEKQSEPLPCGMVPPNILVGEGARTWALEQNASSQSELVTDRSQKVYVNYKRKLANSESSVNAQKVVKSERLDTVGAVAVNRLGETASGVSSGGIALKTPGRLGQAAMYGAGCWSQTGISVTTSGVGEHLTRTLLAKEIAGSLVDCLTNHELPVEAMKQAFEAKFVSSEILSDVDQVDKIGGVLAVVKEAEIDNVEVICVHNSPTMCFAFMSNEAKSLKSIFSQSAASLDEDPRVTAQAISLHPKRRNKT